MQAARPHAEREAPVMEIGRAARTKGPQGKAKLEKAYANLLNSTSRVVGQAKRFAREIVDGTKHATSAAAQVALEGLKGQINEMIPRMRQVISQTRARIFHGETRTQGKIFSLFEPSTEIIRKGKPASPTNLASSSSCRKRKTRS